MFQQQDDGTEKTIAWILKELHSHQIGSFVNLVNSYA